MNDPLLSPQIPVEDNVRIWEKSNHRHFFTALFVLVACGALFFFFISSYLQTSVSPSGGGDVPNTAPVSQEGVGGAIYMSLTPENGTHTGIYRFDVKGKKLDTFFVDDFLTHYTVSFPKKNKERFLVSSNMVLDGSYQERSSKEYQIYAVDKEKREYLPLTKSAFPYAKRQPVWSEVLDGFLYAGYTQKDTLAPELLNTNNWNIYFVGKDGAESLFGSGAHPTLSGDGKYLVALKSDGLYRTDLVTRETAPLRTNFQKTALTNMQIALSPEGNLLAWSDVDEKKIYIFKVDLKEAHAELLHTIESAVFWPVFSPDGAYLAFEEVNSTGDVPTDPQLVIVSTRSWEKELTFDLSKFTQTSMFFDAWLSQ